MKIKILRSSVIIKSRDIAECIREYDRIFYRKEGEKGGRNNLLFNDMTADQNECIAVFKFPE